MLHHSTKPGIRRVLSNKLLLISYGVRNAIIPRMRYETVQNLRIPKIGFGTWTIGGELTADPAQDACSLSALR